MWLGLMALWLAVSPPPATSAGAPAVIPCAAAPAGMACVPGGTFWRGSDDGPADTRPREAVFVQTFYVDVTEVTVEAFDACVGRRACKPARTNYSDFSRPKQPKVGVTWYDAERFCAVQGKRLPSEAQWEKAARGDDGRIYPWGDEPATCERAIIEDARGKGCGTKKQGGHPEKGRTFEVGSRPATLYGLLDMAGNSWEWVSDWYSSSYAACGAACRGIEPRGPSPGAKSCAGGMKVVRGGSWFWTALHARTFVRRPHEPSNNPYHHFGFRCAASAEEAAALR